MCGEGGVYVDLLLTVDLHLGKDEGGHEAGKTPPYIYTHAWMDWNRYMLLRDSRGWEGGVRPG